MQVEGGRTAAAVSTTAGAGWRIPLHRTTRLGSELRYLAEALQGESLAADGVFSARAERVLQLRLGAPVRLTPSGTSALELCALGLDLQPGDEVILPSFTFPSTANAFVLRGAVPVFIDVDPKTLCLDPRAAEAAITPRTRALVAVHYGGVACDLDRLGALVAQHKGVALVEDAAHALGSSWRGRPLGSFGSVAAFSFHATKNLGCGEGGALVVNERRRLARIEMLRDKGTDRARFRRGEVARYQWRELGGSHGLGELGAAVLLAQLEHLDRVTARRRALHARYHDGLRELEASGHVTLLHPPAAAQGNGHVCALLAATERERDRLRAGLAAAGIEAAPHYEPLHASPFGRSVGRCAGSLRVTEGAASRLLRLPLHHTVQDGEVDEVVERVRMLLRGGGLAGRA